MLSSYFDLRSRRDAEARAAASAERREERSREDAERRHQEMMIMLAGVLSRGGNEDPNQNEVIRTLQQVIDDLRVENARLRSQRDNGNSG